jgi:hypothetical protein
MRMDSSNMRAVPLSSTWEAFKQLCELQKIPKGNPKDQVAALKLQLFQAPANEQSHRLVTRMHSIGIMCTFVKAWDEIISTGAAEVDALWQRYNDSYSIDFYMEHFGFNRALAGAVALKQTSNPDQYDFHVRTIILMGYEMTQTAVQYNEPIGPVDDYNDYLCWQHVNVSLRLAGLSPDLMDQYQDYALFGTETCERLKKQFAKRNLSQKERQQYMLQYNRALAIVRIKSPATDINPHPWISAKKKSQSNKKKKKTKGKRPADSADEEEADEEEADTKKSKAKKPKTSKGSAKGKAMVQRARQLQKQATARKPPAKAPPAEAPPAKAPDEPQEEAAPFRRVKRQAKIMSDLVAFAAQAASEAGERAIQAAAKAAKAAAEVAPASPPTAKAAKPSSPPADVALRAVQKIRKGGKKAKK